MRVVFASDHRFICAKGGVFAEGQFPAEFWERYLIVFEELIVVGRNREWPTRSGVDALNLSSREGVSFRFIPNLASARAQIIERAVAKRVMEQAVGDADAVIARLPTETGFLAIECARQLGKPWAVDLAGCPWDGLWNYGGLKGKLYAPFQTWRTRRTVRDAKFVMYVTQSFLQRRYPCRNGLTEACSNVTIDPPSTAVLRQRLLRIGRPAERLIFGLIGTLHGRIKGIQTALQALASSRQTLPRFEFRVLGGGDIAPWQEMAQRLGLGDAVRFDGTIPSGRPVMEWLDEIDVYLQPSFKEGLPRALVEAMSRGCPAIASSAAGIPELLEPECLHRPGDANALAKLLQRAVRNVDWQRRQAERNWMEAFRYGRDVLEPRRAAFWKRFAEYARERGC